ncbi:MAG: YlxR family protein, partial [Janthinobacterium lividum]
MTDGPTAAGPVRTCLGCRRRDDQDRLLRVVAVESTVVVDPRRRALGRGAYVHPDPRCVLLAVKKRAFGRTLRAPVEAAAAGEVLTAYLEGAPSTG